MATKSRNWTRNELLLVFRLYCRTPFGRLHQHNPDIIELARLIDRTPSAVGMKACNFASLDPAQQARNITGLGNASRADRALWDEFLANPDAVAAAAEGAYARLSDEERVDSAMEHALPAEIGPTEIERTVRARRVQSFFRATVLASYDYCCAVSDIALPELLIASHIVPWSVSIERRADPRNGICLNALYDRAFDRGLISIDDDLRIMVSDRLRERDPPALQQSALIAITGQRIRLPSRFHPDPYALRHHRRHVFA